MICPSCGKKNPDNIIYCRECREELYAGATDQRIDDQNSIKSYLVLSILITLCCCNPLGIVAIVYSCKVSELLNLGNIKDAKNASKKAKMWSTITLLTGIILCLIYSILAFMGFFASYGLYY